MTADTIIEEARRPERTVLGHGYQLMVEQVRRAPREFAFGFGFTAVHSVGTIVFSYAVGWATDSVLIPAARRGDVTTASLVVLVVAILTLGAVKGLGLALRRYGAFRAQYRLEQRDRVDVTNRYLDLPIEWHRRHPTGQLLSNVSSDIETAAQIAAPLPMAFGVALMLAITAVLLLLTDPFLALVGFLIGPAIMLNNVFYQRKMRIAAAAPSAPGPRWPRPPMSPSTPRWWSRRWAGRRPRPAASGVFPTGCGTTWWRWAGSGPSSTR